MNSERHTEYLALIPAYLSHQLSAIKSAEAALHFERCAECSAELHYARQLHEHFQQQRETANFWADADAPLDAEMNWLSPAHEQKNFDRLWSRIEYSMATATTAATTPKVSQRRWFSLAIAAGLLLAVSLSIYKEAFYKSAIYQKMTAPEYKTLADSTARVACGQLRIRFIDNFSAADMQNLLQSVDAHIVDGPTPHGVYTLRSGMPTTSVLQKLHLHPAVALVEPTDC